MLSAGLLILLVATGVFGGTIAGIGGPGGIPVLLILNLVLAFSPSVAAATASSIFIVATVVATGLYYYSDGIDWVLAAVVGIPALIGTHTGTAVSGALSSGRFESILGSVLILSAVGIAYQHRKGVSDGQSVVAMQSETAIYAVIALGSASIGVLAGITGIGGPALTIPMMVLLGINPIVAIGAGLASGIIITINTTVGHLLRANAPALLPVAAIGIPYVISQVLGWKYVHTVSERAISYSIAAVAVAGGLVFIA
ncbi:MAG: TSUP family transporter [Halobellus sp.]|uniref:TSUP family transporter n=1 Tax=Halobellus sp. TaxID=1979212 RepID=UPI0035D4C578